MPSTKFNDVTAAFDITAAENASTGNENNVHVICHLSSGSLVQHAS